MTDLFEALEALNPDPENRGNPGPEPKHQSQSHRQLRTADEGQTGSHRSARGRLVAAVAATAAVLLVVGIALVTRDRPDDGQDVVMVETDTIELQQGSQLPAPPEPTAVPLPMLDLAGRDDPGFLANWAATTLATVIPDSLQFAELEKELSRHAALLNHAENVLTRPCVVNAGFEFPEINVLGNVGPERLKLYADLELEPFAADGGYAITGNRARVDSTIGAEANALSTAHSAYVNALPAAEMARYEEVSSLCRQQAVAEIMDGIATEREFHELLNGGNNLSTAAADLLDEHPQAQADTAAWRRCMADAGHPVSSRIEAVEQALAERLPSGTQKNLLPGPIEVAIVGADRICSEQLDYVAQRGAAIAAAEQYLLTNDATTIEVVDRWAAIQPAMRARLEAAVGADFVAEYLHG